MWASLAVLALAACTQGMFGLGFTMVATPLLALFLNYRAAVFLAATPLLVLAWFWLIRNRGILRSARVPWVLLPSIVAGASAGVALQFALSQRLALLLLAALLAFSVALPWGLQRWRTDLSARALRAAPVFGVLAGLTESALNVGAPFMVLFGGVARLTRQQQLIALNLCFAAGKLIQIGLLLPVAGLPVPLWALIPCIAVSLLFYLAGDHFAGRYSEESFRRLLVGFLVAIVLALLVKAF